MLPLFTGEEDWHAPNSTLMRMPVAEQVEACYDEFVSEGVDPAQYNQHTVTRDVDEIGQHLGRETMRPYGSSTGSGTALSYVQ